MTDDPPAGQNVFFRHDTDVVDHEGHAVGSAKVTDDTNVLPVCKPPTHDVTGSPIVRCVGRQRERLGVPFQPDFLVQDAPVVNVRVDLSDRGVRSLERVTVDGCLQVDSSVTQRPDNDIRTGAAIRRDVSVRIGNGAIGGVVVSWVLKLSQSALEDFVLGSFDPVFDLIAFYDQVAPHRSTRCTESKQDHPGTHVHCNIWRDPSSSEKQKGLARISPASQVVQ